MAPTVFKYLISRVTQHSLLAIITQRQSTFTIFLLFLWKKPSAAAVDFTSNIFFFFFLHPQFSQLLKQGVKEVCSGIGKYNYGSAKKDLIEGATVYLAHHVTLATTV